MQNLELYTTPLRKFYATVKNLDAFFTELIEAKANTLPQNDRTVEYAQLLYNILMAWFDLAMLDKDANRATAKAVCKKVQAAYGDGGMSQEERLKAIANIKELASSLLWGASDKAQAKDLKDLLDAANLASEDIIKKGKQGDTNSGSTTNNNAVVKPNYKGDVPDNTTSTIVDMSKPKEKNTSVVDDHNNTTLPSGNNMPETTTTTNQGNTKPVVNDNDEGTVVNLDNYKYVPAENNGNKTDTTVDDKGQTVANIVVYYDKAKQQKQKFKISIKDLSNIKKLSFLNLATNELKEIEPANTITVNIPQSTIEQKISFMVNGEEYTRLYVASIWPQEKAKVDNGGTTVEPSTGGNTENPSEKHEDTPVTPGENTHTETPVTPGENTGKKEDEPAKPETGKEEKPSEDKKEDKKEEEDNETIDDDFMKDIYEKARDGETEKPSTGEKHEETPATPKDETHTEQPVAPVAPAEGTHTETPAEGTHAEEHHETVTPAPEHHEETQPVAPVVPSEGTHETAPVESHETAPAQPSTTEETHTETPVTNGETHETTPVVPATGGETHVEQPAAPSTEEAHTETPVANSEATPVAEAAEESTHEDSESHL